MMSSDTKLKDLNFVNDALEEIQAMLTRPHMYAQNPASLEDQVVLLLRWIHFPLQSDYHSWHGGIVGPVWADFDEVVGFFRVYLRESSLFSEIIVEFNNRTGLERNIV